MDHGRKQEQQGVTTMSRQDVLAIAPEHLLPAPIHPAGDLPIAQDHSQPEARPLDKSCQGDILDDLAAHPFVPADPLIGHTPEDHALTVGRGP